MPQSPGNGGVTLAVRERVFAAADWRCQLCRRKARVVIGRSGFETFPVIGQPGNWLSIDHVDPRRDDDLTALCCRCNSRKGNGQPIYDLQCRGRRHVVHLAVRNTSTDPDVQPTTLCGRMPLPRVGGWTAVTAHRTVPLGMCRLCWRVARREG